MGQIVKGDRSQDGIVVERRRWCAFQWVSCISMHGDISVRSVKQSTSKKTHQEDIVVISKKAGQSDYRTRPNQWSQAGQK